jgi:hypothetical protein
VFFPTLKQTNNMMAGQMEKTAIKRKARPPWTPLAAQKRSGGIFEKLVSSRMHEHTMIEKAMLHMSEDVVDGDSIRSGEDSNQSDEDSLIPRMEPNGSCFRIKISRVNQRRVVSCTRLKRHMKDHQVPLTMPQPILNYFQKVEGWLEKGWINLGLI